MMGRPEFAIGHSRAHAAQNDRKTVVGRVDLDLLQGAPCQEWRRSANERNETADGEAGGHPDHVLLGDADIDQALGEQLLELHKVARTDAVVADRDDARVRLRELDERLGEGLTTIERLDLGCCRRGHRASSLRASSTCSGDGTLWCHSTRSSMKETPLPLIELAMTQRGFSERGAVKAS